MNKTTKILIISYILSFFAYNLKAERFYITHGKSDIYDSLIINSIQRTTSIKPLDNNDCTREKAKPIIKKKIFPKTKFQLQSDSLTAIETVEFTNGDKLIIKNWGCEYYCLTFRFETNRFQNDTDNLPFWFRKIVLLINEVSRGIDAPINIEKGTSALINHIDNYNKLKLGDEIDFGGSDIRDFVCVDKITKLTDKKFALEITFSMGPL